MISEIKQFFKDNEADIVLVLGVILISLISFGGGWLLGKSSSSSETSFKEPIIEQISPEQLNASIGKVTESKEDNIRNQKEYKFVASKNGKFYYYPWCPGVERIKEENKIYFNSKEEAEKAGYKPAKDCFNLKE